MTIIETSPYESNAVLIMDELSRELEGITINGYLITKNI